MLPKAMLALGYRDSRIIRIIMSEQGANTLANLVGKVANIFWSVLFVPFYLTILGHEAYGLVAIQGTLQGIFSILEMGLPAAVTREIAGHKDEDNRYECNYLRSVVRTSETVTAATGCFVSTVIYALSPTISLDWLVVNGLATGVTTQALWIMGMQAGVQFSGLVYSGALVGAGRQVLQNCIISISSFARGMSSVIAIFYFPDVRVFLVVQLVGTVTAILALRYATFSVLPGQQGKFSLSVLGQMFPFASQMIVNSLVLTIAGTLDRIILSKTMPVSNFGYYTLATFMASGIIIVGNSFITAIYPAFVRKGYASDSFDLLDDYRKKSRIMAAVLLPLTMFLMFFGTDVMHCWTRDNEIAIAGFVAVPCLAASSYFSTLNQLPISLASARGFMYPAILGQLFVTAIIAVPLYLSIKAFGLTGAALGNLMANILYFALVTPVIHHYAKMGSHINWLKGLLLSQTPLVGLIVLAWAICVIFELPAWSRLGIGAVGAIPSVLMLLKAPQHP